MNRWLALIPLAVLAALAALFVGWSLKRDPAFKPDALVGQTIPETVLPLLSGDQAGPGNLDLKTAGVGRPMLVNVFASWCAPCKAEQAQLLKLKADGVPIVGVAWKDKAVDTRGFLNEEGDPFTKVVTDSTGRAGIDLGVTGVPETFLVDADGTVVAKHGSVMTPADAAKMEAQWRALAAKTKTATANSAASATRTGG